MAPFMTTGPVSPAQVMEHADLWAIAAIRIGEFEFAARCDHAGKRILWKIDYSASS